MAIFKVLCLIGFVLLSSGYARKHEARHGSRFHHHHGFHRYKHILKRHLGADGISREGPGSKRSERVEESSSKVWQQNRMEKQIPVYSKDESYEIIDKGNGNVKNPNRPNEIDVINIGTETTAPGKEGPTKPGKEGPKEPGKGESTQPENGGDSSEPVSGGVSGGSSSQPENGGSKEPGKGEPSQPENGGGSSEPVSGGGSSSQPENGGSTEGGSSGELEPLPSFEKFQSGEVSDGKSYEINDDCSVTVKKTEKLYQLGSSPPDCVNLAILLEKVLPKDKANFQSSTFMTLEHIIIRSVSLNTATKGVEIAAAYTGTATLIKNILTVSNIRVALSFVWTRSQKFTFDISATFAVGSVPIDMRLYRNEEGYYFTADATESLNATTISRMFKQEDSFLPSTCLQSDLKKANFDSFVVTNPHLRATFADGYGFLFAGSAGILDWDPFDVNILINKPNDLPTTVTIAIYTKSFSISRMFKDLFEMDIKDVPVLGSVEVRNLAFSLSTGDVETPVTVLDIGSEYIFNIPYRKGLKVSFEIPIAEIYIATSIFISPTLISLTISQNGELNLGHVIREFVPDSNLIVTTGGETKLKDWPPFIPDPLSIALVYFHLEASKPTGSWALTKMNMKLKMTDVLSLFDNKININNLELDLNYEKGKDPSTYGVILGRVALGPETSQSPRVDVRIPFPFKNDEISFTFTDFNVKSVVEALAGPDVFPKDFPDLFKHIQLDKITIAFGGNSGSVKTISVDASIPGLWRIFGQFSIGNVGIHFEYGDGASGDGTGGDGGYTNLLHTAESTTQSTWRLVVKGQIVIATCTITIEADFATDLLSISAEGADCSVSISDILEKIHLDGKMLPSMISGFTIFNPRLRILWQRTGDNAGSKSIAFAATTSLFYQSEVELALIGNGETSAVVAGFAVEAKSISEISFLSSLGLSDVAVVYVSQMIPISPYEFLNPSFKRYIQGPSDGKPEFNGITIYARFVPKPNNMLGQMLRKGVGQDSDLKPAEGNEPEIIVKISFPALVFELEVKLGSDGLQIGSISGWRFTYMKLIISKRLIGLSLKCKVNLDSKNPDSIDSTFTGEVSFTFTGTVTISLLWEGVWKNPFGISERLTVTRLGLALGINVVDLVPSFGITGAIKVDVPSATGKDPIEVELTLCIDPSTPDKTVFELHFTRLLLEDVINLFAGHPVSLPRKLAEVGFPDEVQIYFSIAGNSDCFGKRYDPGVEIHGTLQIPFLDIRARIDLSIALPPSSFKLDADLELDPIIYLGGLLKVVDADTDSKGAHLKMYITENLSDLMIDGSCRIEIFGAIISVKLQINSKKFFFEGRLNLWNLFQVYLLVDISMVDETTSVHVIGEMQNDLFAKIKQKASQAIQAGAKEINKQIEGAVQKIDNAKHEVDSLLDSIHYHERKISEAKHACSKAPWYKKYICVGTAGKLIYHGGIIAGLWILHTAAVGLLDAAKYFLKGVEAVIKVGADVVQTLVNAALSIIDIRYVRFEVEMDGVTKIFDFQAKIEILGRWTFTPHFHIDFSSAESANKDIDSAGQSIGKDTMDQVKK